MPISRFLDPKNDFCFKQIFGTEKNKDILIHFLNDILCQPGQKPIIEVSFPPNIQDPDIAAYRQSIVDVLCKDETGAQFIVEMQVSHHKGFEKRAQFYAAKAYSKQILKEDENHKKMAVYAKLKEVIFLAIADFVMFPDKIAWKSEHRFLDSKTYEHDLKDFHFVFMELPKFKKSLSDLSNIQEKWAYFFKHAHKSTLVEMEQLIGNDVGIKLAFQAIDQASWAEEELNAYEKLVKTQLDNLAVEQQKIEDAEARGKAEGEQIGLEKGQTAAKEEVAKKMLSTGMASDSVAEFTTLSIERVRELATEISH
jgi:predicted transposase/invertase (TIGR01784 family)